MLNWNEKTVVARVTCANWCLNSSMSDIGFYCESACVCSIWFNLKVSTRGTFCFLVFCLMAKRSHGSATHAAPLAACWFPMALFAQMMMMKKSKAKKAKAKREPSVWSSQTSVESSQSSVESSQSSVGSSQSSVSGRRRLDLRVEEDSVESVFQEACHRKLPFFDAFASLPRTGISIWDKL